MSKNIFKDIIKLKDVTAVVHIGDDGKVLAGSFGDGSNGLQSLQASNWQSLAQAFNEVKEAEILYENSRLFIKKAPSGFLLVVMGHFAPVALVRLNCDVVLSRLSATKTRFKGLADLFRKQRAG